MEQKIEHLRQELATIESRIAEDSSIYSSPEYPKLAKRQAELNKVLELFDEIQKLHNQKAEAEVLASGSDDIAELARQELSELSAKIIQAETTLDELLLPKDPNDDHNAILEIRAGGSR